MSGDPRSLSFPSGGSPPFPFLGDLGTLADSCFIGICLLSPCTSFSFVNSYLGPCFRSLSLLGEVPARGSKSLSGKIGEMKRGAPEPLVGRVLSLVVSTWGLGSSHLGLGVGSSSISMVCDPPGAPAVILRGFFLESLIFKAPPPGVI